ncbi:MAG: hypothetical protein A2283_21605 [Lentisphaerae bacterium RIFOXYA12_FULL_48_11]|nr:MAG: hypothetical protein A2283_21605 [Lentisphaerae bacterium RIFOXYA12_FULL_48_11]
MKQPLCILFFFMWTTFLFAWGSGHDDHVRFVFKYMPEDIASFWNDGQKDKIIKVWSHFPDGSAFSEEESALIGQEDMAYLKNVTPGRYPFHSSSGKAAAFFMLAKSFRDKNPEKAALFMGALMHSMADASAFNHGALIHYLTYTKYKNVKVPGFELLDLSCVGKYPEISAEACKMLEGFRPLRDDVKFDDVVINIMLSGVRDCKFMAAHENRVVEIGEDGKPTAAAKRIVAKTLAYETEAGVNAVCAAWRIAHSNYPLDMSKCEIFFSKSSREQRPLDNKYKEEKEKFLTARNPADDGIFEGLFTDKVKYPAVGFIAEATYEMNEAWLGFGAKYMISTIARGYKKAGHDVKMISFGDLLQAAPDPKQMPIIVIYMKSGGGMNPKIQEPMTKFVRNGGKVIFLGGSKDGGLTGMEKHFTHRPNKEIPLSREWGEANGDVIGDMKVELVGPFEKIYRKAMLSFNDNPNFIGWNKPVCDVEIKLESADILPLAYLHVKEQKYCIAAAMKGDNGRYKSIWLPQYLFMPFLYSDETGQKNWSLPEQDTLGKVLFTECVALLLK